jgi:hypothetical protein
MLLAVVGCQGPSSREMSRIIDQRRRPGGELYVSDLPSLPHGSKDPETSTNLETYTLPSSPFVQDAFHYQVILDKDRHVFWIRRSGGFAGSEIIFGPGNPDQSVKELK